MNELTRRTLIRSMRRLAMPVALAISAGFAPCQENLITLNIRDEEVSKILEALAVQHRLNLITSDKVQGRVTVNLYDMPLRDALTQILASQGLGFVEERGFFRIVTLEERQLEIEALDVIETRVFTLNHVTNREAQQMLTPLLSTAGALSLADTFGSSGGQGASSGGSAEGSVSSGQRQMLVIRDRRSRLEAIAATLREMDQPPQQVLLEATILSVDLGEDNRLGVDFKVLGGIDFASAGGTSDLTGLDDLGASGSQLTDGLFSAQTLGFANATKGLAVGFIKNNVAAFVEALEETTNATIVSNPRVLALNGHEAEIIVGDKLGYSTVITTETSSTEQIEFLDTGTQLVFRPVIGDDGWIRMEVHPQNSSGVVDPVSGIPSKRTTEINTNILMRSGQTLILGGLINEAVSTTRSQIPVLGNIPLLGFLFRRTQESVIRKELVILLTPHILDPAEAQARAEEANERFEAVRRSHWDSLSPYIRPVLARNNFADAEVLYTHGDFESALGALDRSLALNPTFVPAAVLRERLIEEFALERLPGPDDEEALVLIRRLATETPAAPPAASETGGR